MDSNNFIPPAFTVKSVIIINKTYYGFQNFIPLAVK